VSSLSGFIKRFVAKLWLGGIALLILIALFVSAIRAALPQFNQYQSQFSHYLMEQHRVHFSMERVEAKWQEGGPTLILTDPKFANLERFGVDFSAQQLALQLNIPQSILALSPRFNWLELTQTKVQLGQFPKTQGETSDPVPLLMNMIRTADIDDVVVSFDSSYGELPSVHLSKLRWLGGDDQRQIQLAIAAKKASEPPLLVLVNLSGDTKESLIGQAYINAIDWQWMDDLAAFLPPIASDVTAQTSFELWADFSAATIDSMMLRVEENQLGWLSGGQFQQLSITPSTIHWQPDEQGWDLNVARLQWVLNEKMLLPTHVTFSSVDGALSGQVDQFDLAPLAALSGIFANSSTETNTLLTRLAPHGNLAKLSFEQIEQRWHYRGELNEYGQQQVDGIPAISDLSGVFSGIDSDGQADITFNQPSLDFGPYFKQAIVVDELNASLYWGSDGLRSWFGASQLSVSNKDLSSQLALQLVFEPQQSPVLSLYGETQLKDAKHIDRYLPHVVLSDGLVNYLGEAIQGGRSDNVGLLWQGALDQFPYQGNNGIFAVNAKVEQAKYQFHSDWLPLTNASVDLNFLNAGMFITGHSGRLKQLEFESLTTRIDNLMENPTVVVDVELNQSQAKINDFVFSSVIDNSVGAVLRQLDVKGNIRTKLNIDIPLDGSIPVVSGKVLLNKNDLAINAIDLAVDQVSGEVAFINGDVTASNIDGLLYQQPVTFGVKTKPMGSEHYGIELDLKAKWHSDRIPTSWHAYLDDYLSGSLDWQGRITLKIGQEDVSYQANFKSPMQGLELKLPKPLDKYVNQEEALTVSTTGDANGGQFNLALGSRAEVLAGFSTANNQVNVEQLSLIIGRGFNAQDNLLQDGLSIKIDLDTLQLDEWKSFVNSIEQGQSQDSFLPALKHIEANVKQLTVLEQKLSNVLLSGVKESDSWRIAVNSPQAVGTIVIFDDFEQRGIKAQFQRLVIAKEGREQASVKQQNTLAELQALPIIDFYCHSCQIVGAELGQVSFNTTPDELGIAVNNIIIAQQHTDVIANALWGVDAQGEFTQISGNFNSSNLEKTLELFEFSSGIKDSGIKTEFDLNWRSSIHQLDRSSLNGTLSWNMSEGHIAEVSDKGARIFSLFSLDSLRRKLVLDFRDVFVKGIFFNDFKGDFAINDGVAVTHNAYMDGIAGGIDVVGSINLSSTELDYYITFTPNLFSNIPVIAGVVTSTPQVFILAFALTKVLDPIIDVISQVNFKLSGNVDQPQFVEINRKKKKYKVPEHILPKPQEPTEQSEPDGNITQAAVNLTPRNNT